MVSTNAVVIADKPSCIFTCPENESQHSDCVCSRAVDFVSTLLRLSDACWFQGLLHQSRQIPAKLFVRATSFSSCPPISRWMRTISKYSQTTITTSRHTPNVQILQWMMQHEQSLVLSHLLSSMMKWRVLSRLFPVNEGSLGDRLQEPTPSPLSRNSERLGFHLSWSYENI